MGDFGALVSIKRLDGKDLTTQEVNTLQAMASTLAEELELTGSMGKAYSYQTGTTKTSQGAVRAVNILLSDYHGDEQDFDWHQPVEKKNVQVVAQAVAAKLPAETYKVSGSFEWW